MDKVLVSIGVIWVVAILAIIVCTVILGRRRRARMLTDEQVAALSWEEQHEAHCAGRCTGTQIRRVNGCPDAPIPAHSFYSRYGPPPARFSGYAPPKQWANPGASIVGMNSGFDEGLVLGAALSAGEQHRDREDIPFAASTLLDAAERSASLATPAPVFAGFGGGKPDGGGASDNWDDPAPATESCAVEQSAATDSNTDNCSVDTGSSDTGGDS